MNPDQSPRAEFRLKRADGQDDALSRRRFSSYNEAYDALERYCRDFCCSDDEQIDYRITSSG